MPLSFGMLDTGHYYGRKHDGRLISVAGVHVYSKAFGVAALGNIATLPQHRGRGLARVVTARLCRELLGTVAHVGLNVPAEKDDGLVKILAEPNIIAVSGQEGSFLAGGKVLVPVERSSTSDVGTQVTLEEKEFGIGLKFTPTVLENGRINLRVTPEVSELQDRGTPFTTVGGVTAIFTKNAIKQRSAFSSSN